MLNFQILIFAIKTAFNGQLQPLKRFAVFALCASATFVHLMKVSASLTIIKYFLPARFCFFKAV